MLYSLLVGLFPEASACLLVRKELAYWQALTSEASRVTTLLGAAVFCYSILTVLICRVYGNTVQCLFTVFTFNFCFKPQIKHPAGVKNNDLFQEIPALYTVTVRRPS